jgi:alkylation response protein AidB-like acyl-CoA dehydrogenase
VDFALTDEQRMLRDASRELLTDRAISRTQLDAEEPDPRLWALGAGLGWTGLAVAEEHGGSAQGLAELALVAEELGRAVARGAFVPTMVVASAVSRAGSAALQAEVLPALAGGSAAATIAVSESGAPSTVDGIGVTARQDGEDFVLTGHKTLVQDATDARWLLVSALVDGGPTCLLVDAADAAIQRQKTLDITRGFAHVSLDGVRVPGARRLAGDAAHVQRVLDDAAVLIAADCLGAAERLLEMTVEYAKVRFQFGRAIGSFQAVKHKCATMRIQVDAARAAIYYAAMAADAGAPDASRAASIAKAYAGQALSDLAGEALQVHGGIGFTWEHDLHLYLRRIKTDEVLYGDVATHEERVCDLLLQDRVGA